jgi:ubiquinone/menaquinone biosynthesis C-methylase UbiE
MRWWDEQVLPRLVDVCCGLWPLETLRGPACEGLSGDVLEVGFGSGLNVPHYPAEVRSVTAVEPSDLAWRLAGRRIARASAEVRRGGLDGQRLDAPDASFDGALSTFTLCTIPDASAALEEIRRVLRPGGSLHFVEHGLAPDAGVRRWQHAIEPVWEPLAGGCHLSRPIDELVVAAGFRIDRLDRFYGGGPKPFSCFYLGCATPTA